MKKIKSSLKSLMAIGLVTVFSACDSAAPPAKDESAAAIASSLTDAELRAGDIIGYTTVSPLPLITGFTFTGKTTSVGQENYIYEKKGEHTFTIALFRQAGDKVRAAVNLLLNDSTELGSRFRQIILNPNAEFTTS